MGCSRLTFLLFLYVAADFANPLMPGAVSFPDGAIEALHVERQRMADVVPVVPVVVSDVRIEADRLTWHYPGPTVVDPSAPWLVPLRRALLPRPEPPPPSDDH
jgi:hypothetical protein